ncbi:MAG TPA: glutaredoxin family protein [Candidatus Binatia bacterium]|nr:glutaredoxin family protein [Candidatus Binatia bacterium]
MSAELLLYTRKDCGLCAEMKRVVRQLSPRYRLVVQEVDVDASVDLQEKYGSEVPVLFINGRKAFKYRVTARELEKRLQSESEAIR